MSTFDALKKKLEARRQELSDRLDRIKRDLSKPYHPDSVEQAQERENDDVLNLLGVEVDQELRRVNQALYRIDHHRYGICETCAAPIPLARLEIQPETPCCVKCAA